MKTTKNSILVCMLLCSFLWSGYGQEKKITYNYDDQGQVTSISFGGSQNRSVAKVFDVEKNNPYQSSKNSSSMVYSNVSPKNTNNPTITYLKYEFDNNQKPIKANSSLVILNNSGDIIKRIRDLNYDCQSPIPTKDGKYVGFVYGGILDEDGNYIHQESIAIYDLIKDVFILNKKIDSNYTPGPPIAIDNLVIFVLKDSKYQDKFLVYDLDSKIAYSKIYSRDKIGTLEEISRDGFIFENPNGSTLKALYDTTFSKSKI